MDSLSKEDIIDISRRHQDAMKYLAIVKQGLILPGTESVIAALEECLADCRELLYYIEHFKD